MQAPSDAAHSLRGAGLLLGMALGGFFDGILLHQMLQWHHLLSGVDRVRDLRTQLLADGLFHLLMYGVALVGIQRLWRHRMALQAADAARQLWAHVLLGFGGWHLLDALLSHGLLRIHRIRMDAAQPLLWDLGWALVFGVLPALLAWRWLRRPGRGTSTGGGGRAARAGATTLALCALVAGGISARPAPDMQQVVVLFAPGVSGAAAFDALSRADARVLWTDAGGGVWAVQLQDPRAAWRLYADGALLVSGAGVGWGCVAWSRARA